MHVIFDLILEPFGSEHIFWIFYWLNLVLAVAIFSIMKLPLTESLIVISWILGIYRFRLHKERQTKESEA